MATTRLFLADDHAMFRKALRVLLEREPCLRVVGEAGTGAETLAALRSCKVDILLLDISMPDMPGTAVARAAVAQWPKLAIIVLTMLEEDYYARDMIHLGVKGFVLKRSTGEQLIEAIRRVRDGGVYWDRAVVETAISSFAGKPAQDKRCPGTEELTPRERELCRLLAYGHTNAEIAEQLGISIRTVQTHRQNLMGKLQLQNRAQIVSFAMQNGLFSPP